MLEIGKTYAKPALNNMLGSGTVQDIKRKLARYGVNFTISGRGETAVFKIIDIENRFKLFCIVELGVSSQTDFIKLRDFFYYYFNDEDFIKLPDRDKEEFMNLYGKPISRQTIKHYTNILERNNIISIDAGGYLYYFALGDFKKETTKAEYSKAWGQYWSIIKGKEGDSSYAISAMIGRYGGVARKHPLPGFNGIYQECIDTLNDLIQESYEVEQANLKANT